MVANNKKSIPRNGEVEINDLAIFYLTEVTQ